MANLSKRCLCCGAVCDDKQPTCHQCGEASWAVIVVPVPVPVIPKKPVQQPTRYAR